MTTARCALREKRIIVLKYLADGTLQLISMMIIVGMIRGYVKNVYGDMAGKLLLISEGIGLICAGVMAIMKTMTNKIDTGTWNLWIYYISFASFLLFLIFTIIFHKEKPGKIRVILPSIPLGIIIVLQMLYALADFFVYPNTIMLTEDSVLSTNFLTKMSGAIVALILTLIFEYAWCALSLLVAFGWRTPKGTAGEALKNHLLAVFVTSLGCNAALTGAALLLLSTPEKAKYEKLAMDVKLVELSSNPVFTAEYMERMMF